MNTDSLPAFRILSNRHYTVLLHGNGGGFSRFDGWALNDWNGDPLQEQGAWIFYVRDLDSGELTTFGVHPVVDAKAIIAGDQDYAVITQQQGELSLQMQVHVAQQYNCEVRQLSLTNHAAHVRRLQVTAYLPIALNHPAAHAAHPAFSKLFVQTEYVEHCEALLARRRPRAAGERSPCMAATLIGPGELRWDTDRARFLGRGWGLESPQGIAEGLAAHQCNVLDPAFVLQRTVVVAAEATERLTLVMGAAESRDAAMALVSTPLAELTPGHAPAEFALQTLAGAMFYGLPAVAASHLERQQASGHPGRVWGYGMPTDKPFGLMVVSNANDVAWAHEIDRYWRSMGLDIPLLVLTDEVPLQGSGIVLRKHADVSPQDLQALRAVAAWVYEGRAREVSGGGAKSEATIKQKIAVAVDLVSPSPEPLLFDNGYGGFSADGREYVIGLASTGQRLVLPPVPWVNVLANPVFGCLISETGAGSTWSCNSRERRVTPWSNDPVLDPHDEALFLRDDATGAYWSPLPGPALSGGSYQTRHTFGSTRFIHSCAQLRQETTVFVHRELPVKVSRLQLTNLSAQPRQISVFAYQRLVLGFIPTQSSPFVATETNSNSRRLYASHLMGGEFAHQVAFAGAVGNDILAWHACTDRQRFLGALGVLASPAGLHDDSVFDADTGNGDACFVQRIALEIPVNATITVSFLLGDAASQAEANRVLDLLGSDQSIVAALDGVTEFWQQTLSAVQVETPSPALNIMMNGWLVYQTLVCRIWGRTAFYQSSGAFGFRDQLQDCGALIYTRPDLTRQQILLHASRQFVEGDVQHWWHEPPVDRGLRTRFSDDLNWLPLLTAFYIKTTGDQSLLNEKAPFLTAPLLSPGEDEAYLQAQLSGQEGDVYEHCCRALDISLTQGCHGLPLMGTGDWNDGMNRIGREGRGESVWMGFFLYYILGEFLPFCAARQDTPRLHRYQEYRDHLKVALNADGWDGQWYRRAWYDNGDAVGSAQSDECQIDALAQAWAVISGVAPPQRAEQSLQSLEERLVDPAGKLIRLLTPPFANTPNDPGYIKGYVAGVRENGGQYTHAASWVVRAMAERGKHERALDLLEMILPIAHTCSRTEADRYKTEPYVAAADIYGEPPHVGRGGWTWYTGSSGWLYRVGLESVLGLTLDQGDTLVFNPCIPSGWKGFSVRYRWPQGGVVWIDIENGADSRAVFLEGQLLPQAQADKSLRVRISDPAQNCRVLVRWKR